LGHYRPPIIIWMSRMIPLRFGGELYIFIFAEHSGLEFTVIWFALRIPTSYAVLSRGIHHSLQNTSFHLQCFKTLFNGCNTEWLFAGACALQTHLWISYFLY